MGATVKRTALNIVDEHANSAFLAWEKSRRKLASLEALLVDARRNRGPRPANIIDDLNVLRTEVKDLLAIAADRMKARGLPPARPCPEHPD
jgi:hypothetical protein